MPALCIICKCSFILGQKFIYVLKLAYKTLWKYIWLWRCW